MQPVYSRLIVLLGPDGALDAYFDIVYLVDEPYYMAVAVADAQAIYRRVGLRVGCSHGKT
jgi:hypothetical protein